MQYFIKIIFFFMFLFVIYFILGLLFSLVFKFLKFSRLNLILILNYKKIVKMLFNIFIILILVGFLIIWINNWISPFRSGIISLIVNIISSICFAISISSLQSIFLLLGFKSINFQKKEDQFLPLQLKEIKTYSILIISLSMIISVLIDLYLFKFFSTSF
jgi:hypothetical protein